MWKFVAWRMWAAMAVVVLADDDDETFPIDGNFLRTHNDFKKILILWSDANKKILVVYQDLCHECHVPKKKSAHLRMFDRASLRQNTLR